MTAEERNRRMKYGHDVPRWWIADVHQPAESEVSKDQREAAAASASETSEIHDYRVFKQRRRQLLQREQSRRLNRGLRHLQKGIALLIVIVAFLVGGLPGLAAGACIGLALIAWRFKL
jgi:hypothetical protein